MNHYHSFYRQITPLVDTDFPSVKEVASVTWDHLISPYTIDLPNAVLEKASLAIQSLYRLSRKKSYQQLLESGSRVPSEIKNDSILMAYDFHTSAEGGAWLVEINTNASGFLIS